MTERSARSRSRRRPNLHNDATRRTPVTFVPTDVCTFSPPTHAQIIAHPSCLFAGTYYRSADEMNSGFTWADGGLVITLTPLNHSGAPRASEVRTTTRRVLQETNMPVEGRFEYNLELLQVTLRHDFLRRFLPLFRPGMIRLMNKRVARVTTTTTAAAASATTTTTTTTTYRLTSKLFAQLVDERDVACPSNPTHSHSVPPAPPPPAPWELNQARLESRTSSLLQTEE